MLVGTGFAAFGSEPVALREGPSARNSANHHRFNVFHATVRGRS
jgi:hypothetical protein